MAGVSLMWILFGICQCYQYLVRLVWLSNFKTGTFVYFITVNYDFVQITSLIDTNILDNELNISFDGFGNILVAQPLKHIW